MTSPHLWETVLKLAGALIIVFCLAYLTTRLYAQRRIGSGKQRALRVVDAISLGSQRSVVLLEVGDRILVVGATQNQITLLSEIKDEEFVQRFKKSVEPS